MHDTEFACHFFSLFHIFARIKTVFGFILPQPISHGNTGWYFICAAKCSSFPRTLPLYLFEPCGAYVATTALFSKTNHQCVDRVRCFRTFYNVKINWSHPKRIFDVFGAFVAHASALTFRQWMCSENSPHKNVGRTHCRVVSGRSIPITFVLCSTIRLLTTKANAEGVLGKECLELNLFSN